MRDAAIFLLLVSCTHLFLTTGADYVTDFAKGYIKKFISAVEYHGQIELKRYDFDFDQGGYKGKASAYDGTMNPDMGDIDYTAFWYRKKKGETKFFFEFTIPKIKVSYKGKVDEDYYGKFSGTLQAEVWKPKLTLIFTAKKNPYGDGRCTLSDPDSEFELEENGYNYYLEDLSYSWYLFAHVKIARLAAQRYIYNNMNDKDSDLFQAAQKLLHETLKPFVHQHAWGMTTRDKELDICQNLLKTYG